MAKITINGEVFPFDRSHRPLHEAIALEKTLGIRYGQWEEDLQGGGARALAGFIWLVWRRNGRDVSFADIESGAAEIDYNAFRVEEDEPPPDPTDPVPPPDPSSSTSGGTSRRSAKSA